MLRTKANPHLFLVVLSLSLLSLSLAFAQPAPPPGDWKQVEEAMGRSGQVSGDVIRFAMPRKDLHVTLDGVELKPALALGSWAAFKKDSAGAMLMGDLVLTEAEVQPVMPRLLEGGVHESAVHNHLIGESPRVLYMHIASHGDAVQVSLVQRTLPSSRRMA